MLSEVTRVILTNKWMFHNLLLCIVLYHLCISDANLILRKQILFMRKHVLILVNLNPDYFIPGRHSRYSIEQN